MATNLAYNKIHIFGEEQILTVSELSLAIKGQIEENFYSLKLRGEVSGIKRHTSGHTYLSLKDNDSVINAICWRGTKLGISLEDGMEIVVKGRVTSYPARSQYQFIIEEANIAGEGALLKLLNERKKLFASMGYFENRRPLPKFPRLIGIVTSRTGAVLQDMRHRLEDRYPFCQVLVWPTNVQGTGAADQIASAIRGFNFMTDRRPDILIVARGGGSIEDLWPFNEEIVVRATFESKIPVISAIGHETDTTLIDYASDLRAPTPTAAIELATPVLSEVRLQISDNGNRMQHLLMRVVQEQANRLLATRRLSSLYHSFVISTTQKFDDRVDRLFLSIENFVNAESLRLCSRKLISLQSYLNLKKQKFENSVELLNKILGAYLCRIAEKSSTLSIKLGSLDQYVMLKKQGFESFSNSFEKLRKNYMSQYIERFRSMINRLEQSSFKKILEKGFCFITDNLGRTIETKRDFEEALPNGVTLHFTDGCVKI